jgi:glycosyltransferase involved in cell wall biosynthesis
VAVPVVLVSESVAFGGAEVAIVEIARHLNPGVFDVTVFTPDAPAVQPLLRQLETIRVPVEAVPRRHGKYDPVFAYKLLRYLRRTGAQLVHLQLTHIYGFEHIIPFLRACHVPVIVTTEHNSPYARPRLAPARRLLKRLNSRWVDGTFVVSKALQRLLTEEFNVSPDKVWQFGNSVDVNRFSPSIDGSRLRASLGVRDGARVIITIARLEHQKGITFLIAAALQVLQRHPEAEFWLVGDGSLRSQLQAQVEQSGVAAAVRFLGLRDNLPELLAAADMFVLPSLYEGLPLSVLEAMAMAKAVVATRVGGTPDVVDDGVTGLLIPPSDPQALAEAIERLLESPDLAARLAAAGAHRVRSSFSVTAVVDQIAARYTALLAQKGNSI